jgi:hypothetical protein
VLKNGEKKFYFFLIEQIVIGDSRFAFLVPSSPPSSSSFTPSESSFGRDFSARAGWDLKAKHEMTLAF